MLVVSIITLAITLIGIGIKAATAVSAFNSLNDLLDIEKVGQIKGFDEGYVGISVQAIDMLGHFMQYAQYLIILCAFLALIFNAFKLWGGAAEIKKVFVDAIYKCVIVMALMIVYPQIVVKTVDLATTLGVEASGGQAAVENAFANLAVQVKNIWSVGTESLYNSLSENGAQKDEDGNIILSDSVLKVFMEAGLSQEEAKAWAEANGMKSGETKNGFWDRSAEAKKQKAAESAAKKSYKNSSKEQGFKNNKKRVQYMKQSLAIIDSLAQVLVGADGQSLVGKEDSGISRIDILTMGDDALKKVFYNPYIGDSKRLSVSTLMKTAIVIQEIASSGALAPIDSVGDKDKDENSLTPEKVAKQSPRMVVSWLGHIIRFFMYKLMLVLAVLLVMIEYILSVIEFLIVAAVSSLLIPFYFIDATKQYAANILKTIFSYFLKIMVTTMMVFFTVTMYINMGSKMPSLDLSSATSILYFAFTCMLGVILTKNCGKVASAVISGNPSLGMGDVMNEFRGIGRMAHMAQHMAQSAGNDIKKTAGAAQGVVGGAVRYNASMKNVKGAAQRAEADAFNKYNNDVKKGTSTANPEQINKSARNVYKDTVKAGRRQMMGDGLFKALTGVDRGQIDNNHKSVGIGSHYVNEQGLDANVSAVNSTKHADLLGDAAIEKERKNMEIHKAPIEKDKLKQKENMPEIEG